jgi:hypothetical protein
MGANSRNVVFLIGAGASKPACIPQTSDITLSILNDGGWQSRIIRYLKCEIDKYFISKHFGTDCNYEDIFQLISQIYMSEIGQYPNPMVNSFLEVHRAPIEYLLANDEGWMTEYGNVNYGFDYAIRNIWSWIKEQVVNSLNKEPCLSKLTLWRDISKDKDYDGFDIFTLNHDLVFEKLFESSEEMNDGFCESQNEEYKVWDQKSFERLNRRIELYKLHGSIGWYYCKDIDKVINRKISPNDRFGGGDLSEILIGTYDKMLEYTGGIFTDLFWHFKRVLDITDMVIACGYGFRDKGINNYLIDWLVGRKERKIALIHSDIERLMTKKASPAISCYWKKEKDRFIHIPGLMGSITWETVRKKIEE